jgi:hypothetical protein
VNDPFPAVVEAAATGQTADLFADIRATVGVRVVNLVWRHLATIEGALPWSWSAVKPLYVRGIADGAVLRFRDGMVLPPLAALDGERPASVDAVLASYDHSNTINLFALSALVAWLEKDIAADGAPDEGPRLPAPDVMLPKLASEEDVTPETWQRVLRLNRFGDSAKPLILASMYRHLAHAPTFLEQMEKALAPAAADGSLAQAIAANRAAARAQARVLARAIRADRPPMADAIVASVSAFRDHAIGKMVTICRAIRVSITRDA